MENDAIEKITQNQIALFNLLASLAEKITRQKPIVGIKQLDGSVINTCADPLSVEWLQERSS